MKGGIRVRLQSGIGLPAAIFVITLLAAMAAGINLLIQQGAETFEEEVALTRAYYAAESGAWLAMHALFPPHEYPDYHPEEDDIPGLCNAISRELLFTAAGLNACSADITCEIDAEIDDQYYITFTSIGTCDDVRRTVQVRTSF